MRSVAGIFGWIMLCLMATTCTAPGGANAHKQRPAAWHDPSPHTVHFVTVEKDVKLEVLDWGGTGRPLVLLAGLGNTAHVFDNFAPKLTPQYHVYGITRRGFGGSSEPKPDDGNYSADRLGDDVLAVLNALKIERPVLVGHSIAGEELSSVGSRYPKRVAGLVYLDAGYCYAYYGGSLGCLDVDVDELQRKLRQLVISGPAGNYQLAQGLLQSGLPTLERDLRAVPNLQLPTPPSPAPADMASFQAFSAWFARTLNNVVPESELREITSETPDGKPAGLKTHPGIPQAILAGEERYTQIRVPVLAIYAHPHKFPPFVENAPAGQAAAKELDASALAQQKAFEKGLPSARVDVIPHANHYLFISNQAEVLRDMHAFISALQQ